VVFGIALSTASFGYLARLVPCHVSRRRRAGARLARARIHRVGSHWSPVLLFDAAPHSRLARHELQRDVEKERRRASKPQRGTAVRNALCGRTKITLTVVLLTAAALLLRSYASLARVDPGFAPTAC